jgi:hypothetical protein
MRTYLFCFIYGRIGHSDKECPEGEVGVGDFRFGVELHASPPKRIREVMVQTRAVATHFLNFEGARRTKLQDQASWLGSNRGRAIPRNASGMPGEEDEVGNPIPKEEEHEPMQGVTHMDMKEATTSSALPPVYGLDGVQQRVSFDMNLGYEDEGSTGMSCPPGSLMKLTVSGIPQILQLDDHVESLVKSSSPDRGGERN